jgi:hypothetical protein
MHSFELEVICFCAFLQPHAPPWKQNTRLAWHAERTEGIKNINICSEKVEGGDQLDDLRANTK